MAGSRTSPVLIDREEPLAELAAALDAADRGRASVVIVSGEAGIGKSRLLAEHLGRAREAGAAVAVASCVEVGADLPYLPLAALLRRLAEAGSPAALAAGLGSGASVLAGLVPDVVAPRDERPGVPPAGPDRARLFEVVLAVVARLASRRTVVLALEDVQWLDEETAAFVAFLARNVERERLLVCLTERSGGVGSATRPRWLADLRRVPIVAEIEVGPLDRASVVAQLTTIATGAPRPELLERVWRRSDGNPMFAEELWAAAVRGERLPTALAESLEAQLRALDSTTRSVLGVAAIIGRPFDERLVRIVLDRPAVAVRDALRSALDARLIVMVDDGERLAFRHGLHAEAVERTLLPDERRTLHAAVAASLVEHPELADATPAGPAAERAHHWLAAGRFAEGLRASLEAADAATRVAAYEAADEQYERALRLVDEGLTDPPDDLDLTAVRQAAADAADLAGRPDRALDRARQALAAVDEPADPERAALLHGRIGYFLWVLGRTHEALEEHRRAVAIVSAAPSDARIHVVRAYAGALMGAGRYAESRPLAEQAARMAHEAGDTAEEARARTILGSDLVVLRELERGLEELAGAARLADEAGVPDTSVVAHYNRALNLLGVDRLDEALAEATEARAIARASGLDRRYGPHALAAAADALLRLGRLRDALELAAEAAGLTPDGRGTVYLDAVAARAATLLGDSDAAQTWLARAGELAGDDLDPDLAAYLETARAEVALAAGRPLDAVAAVRRGLDALGDLDDVVWVAGLLPPGAAALARLADDELAAARSDAGTAAPLGRRLTDAATVLDRPDVPGSVRAAALATLAELDGGSSEGTPDALVEAAERWIAAGEAWDAAGGGPNAAYARYRAAESLLRARRDRGRAEALLRDAAARLEAIGAGPMIERARGLARQARIPLATTAVEPHPAAATASAPRAYAGPPLSARELEVLALVAAGRSNGEIADELFISRKTASVHVSHILDKLGAASRVEAAILADRLGLVAAEPERR